MMLVIIRNAPDTPEGKRGVKMARTMIADIVLLQNAVYFVQKERLEDLGFYNTAYVLEDDIRLRGVTDALDYPNLKSINYDGLVDLMAENDKVIGMF
jgi:sulfur relay protein TusB/DsrH